MHRHLSLLVFLLVVRPITLAAQRPGPKAAQPPAERELFRLENAWAAALVKRDAAFFRRTLDPDYVYSDERGTFGKSQVVAEQTSPSDTVEFSGNENMRAHVHGNAAVVTGILTVRGHGAQGAFAHRYRYTDSWLRRNGRWVMIASQDYELPR